MALLRRQFSESLQDLSDVHVVDLVHLYQIFEQHEDHVGKEARLPTKASVLKVSEYLCHQFIEEARILEDLRSRQGSNVI